MCLPLRRSHRFALSLAWQRKRGRDIVDRRGFGVPSWAVATFGAASESFDRAVQSISLRYQEANNLIYFHG
jgi:hypothetical protein